MKSWRKHLQQNVDLYPITLLSQRNPIFHALLSARQAAYKTTEENLLLKKSPSTTDDAGKHQAVTQQYDQVLAKEDKVAIQDAGIPFPAEQVTQLLHNTT